MNQFRPFRQSGFTLLEVLVSIFVVLVGLLGVASMIPAGRFEMTEARKIDMGSNISRALLRSAITQMDREILPDASKSYYIVPSDLSASIGTALNAQSFQELTSATLKFNDNDLLEGADDVLWSKTSDGKAILYGESAWSNEAGFDSAKTTGTGDYMGFVTLIPTENGYFDVTAAVSYKSRKYSNEDFGVITSFNFNSITGLGTWSTATNINLERGQYVLVKRGTELYWYKVDFAYSNGSQNYATLVGPSWQNGSAAASGSTTLIVPGKVIAVSSRVVRLGQ